MLMAQSDLLSIHQLVQEALDLIYLNISTIQKHDIPYKCCVTLK